jgi:hypothetical protein
MSGDIYSLSRVPYRTADKKRDTSTNYVQLLTPWNKYFQSLSWLRNYPPAVIEPEGSFLG